MTAQEPEPRRKDDAGAPVPLGGLEKDLINAFQHGFPLDPRPYAAVARRLGVTEDEVFAMIETLRRNGVIDRIGPVFKPHRAGWSTLAAMSVPPERLEDVAALISREAHVNHNYERDHHFNLWFVVTAPDEFQVREILAGIEEETGLPVMDLPLVEAYHIDLGFPLP
jgi:DNA-binding Lrp family transcriptional regulator